MKFVKDILNAKGYDIWFVGPTTTVFNAVRMMSDKGVGSLLVMDGDQLMGIITERDYARKVILEGKSSKDTPVQEIMTTKVLCVSPSQSIEEGMALMTDKRARHLPVVEGNQVVGVVSIGDLVKAIITEQQFVIDQLQHYIAG